jgi:hypothetical protein
MKFLAILSLLSVFHIACKQQESTTVPDCVCADLEKISVTKNYGTQEGTIIFSGIAPPNLTYIILPKVDFVGAGKIRYSLCTDSALIKQIQSKQIKDSTLVIMTDVEAYPDGTCHIYSKRTPVFGPWGDEPYPRIRVKTIDKK